jgi:hypothetical protein
MSNGIIVISKIEATRNSVEVNKALFCRDSENGTKCTYLIESDVFRGEAKIDSVK